MATTSNNPNYFIVPSAVTIQPNSLDSDPQYVIIGTAIGASIRLTDKWSSKAFDGSTVNIGLSAGTTYKKWTLRGGNYHLPDTVKDIDCHVYIRVPKQEGISADFAFTNLDLDILGNYHSSSVPGGASTGDNTSDLTSASSDFYFVKFCTLSYDSETNLRTITNLDYGYLGTDRFIAEDTSSIWDSVFSYDKAAQIVSLLVPFGNFLFRNPDSSIVSIIRILTDAYDWAAEHISNTALATTAWINKFFLSKKQEGTAEEIITFNKGIKSDKIFPNEGDSITVDADLKAKEVTADGGVKTDTLSSVHGDYIDIPDLIHLRQGAEFGTPNTNTSYSEGIKGCKIFWNGTGWMIQTDYLSVTKKAQFQEIEVNKVTHVGGQQLLTAASCVADFINEIRTPSNEISAYRVFFRAEDGDGLAITNDWKTGDLAYCQTFNIKSGTSSNVSNKYYWRLVIGTGTTTVEGVLYNYITLSNSDYDGAGAMSMIGAVSDAPAAGDHIVQFGMVDGYADALTTKERQGATLLSGSGKYKRSLIMWEKINDYVIPEPRVYLSPDRVELKVDSFKMITGGGSEKPVDEYVLDNLDGRIIINGDDNRKPTTDSAFINSLIAKINDPSIKSISDLVGAIYITTDKTFYMLTYKDGEYSWQEDTDGTLARLYEEYEAQKIKIDQILDDYCFSEDERSELRRIIYTGSTRYERASELYLQHGDNKIVDSAYSEYEEAWTELKNMVFDIDKDMPCYLSDAPNPKQGVRILSFTKQEFENAYQLYLQKYEAFNDAIINFTVNNIGSAATTQAIADVKDYITQNIQSITGTTINESIQQWSRDYADKTFVTDTVFQTYTDSLQLYTQWIDTQFPERAGGTGIWTKLSQMFVGTNTLTFDSEGNIRNIDKSGLVTDTSFASLFSEKVDSDGNIMALASFSAYTKEIEVAVLPSDAYLDGTRRWYSPTTKKYYYKKKSTDTKYYYTEGTSAIFADNVFIESGNKSLGNYFSLSNGNLFCQNITVVGVINNLINVVERTSPQLIPYNDGIRSGKSLDILCLGDVIKINSLNLGENLFLPYYIDNDHQFRANTLYNGAESPRPMTAEEMKQLIGRKITIFFGRNVPSGRYLYGSYYFTPYGGTEDAVQNLLNGNHVVELPSKETDFGILITPNTTVHLEMKLMMFYNTTKRTFFYGMGWSQTSAYAQASDTDIDTAWQ